METIKVIEPRVNVKNDTEKNHVVIMGGLRYNEQVITADSWGSPITKPTQSLFTINPPSTTTITDRYLKIRAYLEITVDADLQLGTNDALRQFPLASILDVLTVQINGESISDNVSDKFHALMCYGNNNETRIGCISTTPTAPDAYQVYSDWTIYGSAKNPLADYGENTFDPRGGFVHSALTPRVFRVVITEPVLLSPFLSGMGVQEEGFVNVNQMNLAFRWKSDLSQILSHSTAGNPITSVNVVMYQAPEILATFITPNLTQMIPQLQILPYHKSQDYIKTIPPINSNSSTRIVSDSIKLSQIPRKLYLFCRHQRQTSNQNTSDSFLRIDGLNVLWNNQSGLFSSATTQDLYEISKRNGLNMSWNQWYKFRGSVMCIEFGKDLGLLDNEAPGVQGQYTLQIQMDVTNTSSEIFTAEFFQIFMMEGTFSLSENNARASLGNLTQQVVLATRDAHEIDYNTYENLQGGSFWTNLKGFVNKIARGVQSGVTVASKFAPMIGTAFPELMPLAAALPMINRVASGVQQVSGGRLVGGRMSRKQLKARS